MAYAFDEFRSLVYSLPSPVPDNNPTIKYICALLSEFAYHHVPPFGIDRNRRAKIVPCESHAELVSLGFSVSIVEYLQSLEFEQNFVVVDRGVIAVGIKLRKYLFLAFRGTRYLYDWKINLRASLTEMNVGSHFHKPGMRRLADWRGGQVHKGFAEEALRIVVKIMDALGEKNIDDVDHIFLAGHSLGGAVAALSEHFIRMAPVSTTIFGAPRYCDVAAYYSSPYRPPTQIQRPGDIIPLVPPLRMGYADHPYQFSTDGQQIIGPVHPSSLFHWIWLAALFLGKQFEPHNMEAYRREIGRTANARFADANLLPPDKLLLAPVHF